MRDKSTAKSVADERSLPSEPFVSARLVEAAGLLGRDLWCVESSMLLSRVARLWEQSLEAVLKPHSLIPAEMRVLSSLLARPDRQLKMGDIKRSVIVTAGAVTKAVARLEALGLVEKRPDANDGRIMNVVATDEGQRLASAAHNDVVEHFENAFGGSDAVVREAYSLALSQLAAGLQRAE